MGILLFSLSGSDGGRVFAADFTRDLSIGNSIRIQQISNLRGSRIMDVSRSVVRSRLCRYYLLMQII